MRRLVAVSAGLIAVVLVLLAVNRIARERGWLPEPAARLEAKVARKLGLARPGLITAAALSAAAADPAPAAGPVPPTQIGVNVGEERSFANLLMGERWFVRRPDGGGREPIGAEYLDADGNLKAIPAGERAIHPMKEPTTPAAGADFRCTFKGQGTVKLLGRTASGIFSRNGEIRFRYRSDPDSGSLRIEVTALNPADPVRDLDCREAALSPEARFDPAFVSSLRGFRILRFMDWQNTNANEPATWARRATPRSRLIAGGSGAAIEDMVALAIEVGADPWFTIPWNADADYVRRFAQTVHDLLPKDRRVYVEVSNEVWNTRFPVGKQAIAEATAAGSKDVNAGRMQRYADRIRALMPAWEAVFADDPRRLVRVAATQHVNPAQGKAVLGYKGTAGHVDALATAPYFGRQIGRENQTGDPDAAFARIDALIDETLAKAAANRAVAASFGKRYIAYEGGQHIVLKRDVEGQKRIQRDRRMYDAYRRYLDGWRARIGDALVLFTSVKPINRFGAWGLIEYPGQPESDAPKWRAVKEALRPR